MEVENDVQLTHVAEVLVKHLDQELDDLQREQLISIRLNHQHEIQRGKSSIDNFPIAPSEKAAVLRLACQHLP